MHSTQAMITSFDVPGSTQTYAFSINAAGLVTGWYLDSRNVQHGFLRSPHGAITSFDPPGSTGTEAVSIDDLGVITGSYINRSTSLGFLRVPLPSSGAARLAPYAP